MSDQPPPPSDTPESTATSPEVPVTPVGDPPPTTPPWPSAAKGTVAGLVVLALVAGLLAFIGWTRDSDETDTDAAPSPELIEATERAEEAETRLETAEADLETARAALASVTSERDEALTGLAEAEAQIETLAELLGTTADDLAESEATVAELTAIIADLAEPFPVAIEPDLTTAQVDGQYAIVLTEVRCFNLPQCGTPPGLPNASLTRTATELLLNVPGQFQIAMTGRDRQLFGVSEAQTLIPECADIPRPQSTAIALHAGSGQVQLDGSLDLSAIGGSVTVTAPAFGECAAGEVWYAVRLTRVG